MESPLHDWTTGANGRLARNEPRRFELAMALRYETYYLEHCRLWHLIDQEIREQSLTPDTSLDDAYRELEHRMRLIIRCQEEYAGTGYTQFFCVLER